MKNFKKTILFLLTILLTTPIAHSSELSAYVEATLRKPLNLVVGPATQVVDFEMDGKTYVIVIADLSFNKNITPFNTKKKKLNRTSEKEITQAVKNTFIKLQNTKYKTKNEIVIIIFDKKLFGRTDNKTLRKFIFKGEFNKGRLVRVSRLE
ncbi:hypothetical protein TTHT_1676 [Thermotomaculum hydrothermale]|uniref:Uncharacterized protein n=1 Tax=Thermotomaculum hydrothermale TaxID=981385 RepID=A0A7R6PG67_9BACT|nr:hypothetical protein [Thermotomaculum hydrothermale]BBB33154.1 hypothetical protein TTHT_1676 [Thermotomaculum hydrothermale]